MSDRRRVLVVGATWLEVSTLRDAGEDRGIVGSPTDPVWRRALRELDLSVALSGVGKSVAAARTAALASTSSYQLCVNVGIAGAFRESGLAPGDVVVATDEVLADEGTLTPSGFVPLDLMNLPYTWGFNHFQLPHPLGMKPELLSMANGELGFRVVTGSLCTVSTCSGTDERAREIYARYGCLAESMEGASCAIAARTAHTPFVEVRGISNFTGDRYPAQWRIPEAAENAQRVVLQLLESWSEAP